MRLTDSGAQSPLLIGLELEEARRRAAACGWQVENVARTAPPSRAPSGRLRVIQQKVIGPRALGLVVAASSELTCAGATARLR